MIFPTISFAFFFAQLLFFCPDGLLAMTPPIHEIKSDLSLELSIEERNRLFKGELVMTSKNHEKEILPQYYFYQKVDLTPIEVFAIFADLEHQQHYVPNLISGLKEKVESPHVIWMKYELKTPWPLPNAKYITRNEFWGDGKGNYQLLWNQIQSNSTDETVGEARFLNYQGQSIFTYTNLIRPKTRLASVFKGRFREDILESYRATFNEILRVKAEQPKLLEWEVGLVQEILDGKNPYQEGFLSRPIAKN